MPKSKEYLSSSDSDSDVQTKKKAKKQKTKHEKKPEAKAKAAKAKVSDEEEEEEEGMYPLSKMRFISVSEFKGKKLVSIREYYNNDDGDLKPGRKGISLNRDQWEKLKDRIEDIDNDLED